MTSPHVHFYVFNTYISRLLLIERLFQSVASQSRDVPTEAARGGMWCPLVGEGVKVGEGVGPHLQLHHLYKWLMEPGP